MKKKKFSYYYRIYNFFLTILVTNWLSFGSNSKSTEMLVLEHNTRPSIELQINRNWLLIMAFDSQLT